MNSYEHLALQTKTTSDMRSELQRITAIAISLEVAAGLSRRDAAARLSQVKADAAKTQDSLERRISTLAAKNTTIEHTNAHLQARLVHTADRLEQTHLHLGRSEEMRAAMQRSISWRLTAPIRMLARVAPAPLVQAVRLCGQALWWALTPWRIPARRQIKRKQSDPATSIQISAVVEHASEQISADVLAEASVFTPTPQTFDPFALDRIAPLQANFSPALTWYDFEEPEVSIIVLNWNRSAMTALCLQHIWEHTTGYRYEVLVIDNGSSADEIVYLRESAGPARIISLGSNRYFGEANNIGVEAARGTKVCLLNNDVFVHENWLFPLVQLLAAQPQVGAVGPRFLYPDGRMQEAGALCNADGSVVQIGRGGRGDDPTHLTVRKVDYVSAACVLLRRDVYLHVLGFDMIWEPAYYEDVDLCLKLRLVGLHTFYTPQSTVTHFENATSRSAAQFPLDSIITINRTKFVDRWGTYLAGSAVAPTLILSDTEALSGAPDGPRVAFFWAERFLLGERIRYLLTAAEALRGIANVSLVGPMPCSRVRLLTLGRELGLELSHVRLLNIEEARREGNFHLAFVPDGLFSSAQTWAQHNILLCLDRDAHTSISQRSNSFKHALAISPFAARQLEEAVKVEILEPPVRQSGITADRRSHILHVGGFRAGIYCQHQHVMIEAFRSLVQRGLMAELHLAGVLHPDAEHCTYYAFLREKAADLPIFFHPNIPIEHIGRLQAESRVYWHVTTNTDENSGPDRSYAPPGISLFDAMAGGCIPVILSADETEVPFANGVVGFIVQDVDEFCSTTYGEIMYPGTMRTDVNGPSQFGGSRFQDQIRTCVAFLIEA